MKLLQVAPFDALVPFVCWQEWHITCKNYWHNSYQMLSFGTGLKKNQVCAFSNGFRTMLVLGYWVLGNIHRYWVVSVLWDTFCCSGTQYSTNQTAVSTVHMPVHDYLVPLLTCTLSDIRNHGHHADMLMFIKQSLSSSQGFGTFCSPKH